jgi:hypothetical protein
MKNILTNEQRNEIKKLYSEKKPLKEIAEEMKVSVQTVLYWADEEQKSIKKKRGADTYRKKSKEQKKAIYEKQRDYRKKYQFDRYHNDEEFRKRYINYQKKYQNGIRKKKQEERQAKKQKEIPIQA